MRQKSPGLLVISNIIWIGWFVACLTRSNEAALTVCLVGAIWNALLLLLNERRKGKKDKLQFIICGAFFLIVAMGNLWYIVLIR